jgi:hypothetical protein
MKGYRNLLLLFLVGCSLFNKKVNIEQVSDSADYSRNINTRHLIMQEKQSLSIAMLQIEQNKPSKDSVILVEAKSLLYTVNKKLGIKLSKTNILPEARRLFSLSNRLKLKIVVLCKSSFEEKTIRKILRDTESSHGVVNYSYVTDLSKFSEFKPILIVGEIYETLWTEANLESPTKNLWFSVWVPLQNTQRSQISQDDWVKFL